MHNDNTHSKANMYLYIRILIYSIIFIYMKFFFCNQFLMIGIWDWSVLSLKFRNRFDSQNFGYCGSMTWSELGVVIPSWIGLQSDIVAATYCRWVDWSHDILKVFLQAYRVWTLPPPPKTLALSDYHQGAKEYNTPSEAPWLCQRLGITQLTW